jgi:hypothetical protein
MTQAVDYRISFTCQSTSPVTVTTWNWVHDNFPVEATGMSYPCSVQRLRLFENPRDIVDNNPLSLIGVRQPNYCGHLMSKGYRPASVDN